MSQQSEPAESQLVLLSRYVDGSEALLKQRLAELLEKPEGELSTLHKLRRATRETELWLQRLEHAQNVRAGFNLPSSGRLGTISLFRCRIDSATARIERGQPVDMPRLIDQAQSLLDRLSFADH